jgi:hypothetical protein
LVLPKLRIALLHREDEHGTWCIAAQEGAAMWIRQGRLRRLLTSLFVAAALSACNSPEDVGHRVYGYVNEQGAVAIAPAYLDALPFHEGLAAVQVAAGWGFIDAQGRWVIPARYVAAGSFASGRAPVADAAGRWGYVDHSGRPVIAPQFLSASVFMGDRAYVQWPDQGVRVIDAEGRVIPQSYSAGTNFSEAFDDELLFSGNSYWGVNVRRFTEAALEAVQREGLVPLESSGPDEWSGYVDLSGRLVIEPAFDEANPFVDGRALVRKAGKYGFIDRAGRIVVPLAFDEALVRFSRDRTVAVRDGHAWLIDTTGRQVADLGVWPWPELGKDEGFSELSSYIGFSDFFADGLMPWQRDGKWGYVGVDGTWLIEPRYQSAQPFHGGLASVQRDGQGLLIDTTGHETAQAAGGWIGPRDGSLSRAGTPTRWGFLRDDGTFPTTLPFATTRISFMHQSFVDARPLQFSEGLALVSRIAPHRWRLIDTRGRTRAEERFEWLEAVGDGLYAFVNDQRWGLADRNLKVLSPARFDQAPAFVGSSEYAHVEQGGRSGCVDRRGRWTALPLPRDVKAVNCSVPLMTAHAASGTGVIGMDGRWRIPPEYSDALRLTGTRDPCFALSRNEPAKAPEERVACVSKQNVRYSETGQLHCEFAPLCLLRVDQQWQRLDLKSMQRTGAVYDECQYPMDYPRSGLLVRQGQRWGLFAPSGKLALPVAYDEIVFTESAKGAAAGVAVVRRGERWGAMTLTGHELLPARYEELKPAGTGFLAMRVGSTWGIVDIEGHTVVAPRFELIQAVRDGLMLVKQDGRYSLVTGSGTAVLEPAPDWMQRIFALTTFSDQSWAAFTTDRRLYFVDRRTLATLELAAPAGYVWVLSDAPQPRAGQFTTGRFGSVMSVDPVGAKPDSNRRRDVLIDANGRQLMPQLFESAYEHGSRFTVTVQGKCGVLDDQGRWIAAMRHDHCDDGDGSQRIVVGDEDY